MTLKLPQRLRLGLLSVLMMVVGGLPPDSKDIQGQRERVRDALLELLPHARHTGVKLGLEPLHPMYAGDRSLLNSLRVANDLCDELGPLVFGSFSLDHLGRLPRVQIRQAQLAI